MISSILEWLKRQKPKEHRIVYDPKLGYCAQGLDIVGWCAIEPGGSLGISADTCHQYDNYWVKTQEEAGQRINLHATSRGQKIVWSA